MSVLWVKHPALVEQAGHGGIRGKGKGLAVDS